MQIIDAHHHIWRQSDLPWLMGPEQPRIFGPYEAIRRDYLIEEFRAEAEAAGVAKSVYVQANWPAEKFADEAAWVQATADETGWPHAIVGYADFTADDVRPQLDALSAYPLMRGVRMQLHWHETPLYRFASRPDLARDPGLQANVAHLGDYGWSFDLQVFADQMTDAETLVAACPGVTFILQHAGMLEDTGDAGWKTWRTAMQGLAAHENVVSKTSGLGTFVQKNDPDLIARIVCETVGIFGADRCLFGSNFPIEKLWTTYGDLVAAHTAALKAIGPETAEAVLRKTAERVYRLGED